jgi:hypothetical protein
MHFPTQRAADARRNGPTNEPSIGRGRLADRLKDKVDGGLHCQVVGASA